MTIAAIDIDAQCAFSSICPDELPVPEAEQIVPQLNAHAALADYRVLTRDAHSAHAVWIAPSAQQQMQPLDYPNANVSWVRHAEVGTKGFEPLPKLPQAIDYDFLVYKGVDADLHPFGACFHDLAETVSTGLIEWLQAKQCTTIIAGGLATDYCVKDTVLQLCKHGNFRVLVNLAACRGIDSATTTQAIEAMQQAGALMLENSQAIAQHIAAAQP